LETTSSFGDLEAVKFGRPPKSVPLLLQVMSVDESLMCSFRILKPTEKHKFGFSANRPLTPPRKR